ncbi:Mitochondrial Protein Translocase (MPT) Family [Phytophthora cinnamomi]|uniref:Mitochondrial Protein Translocase (MPT) Family n=1 Tax=Phytophthora cinnamomi TaxID=4785 RepID=UPI00355995BC|nr:Mitochondrial Protein Translocase (MPT) Family [Phytophthora cinnamomi]
MNFGGMMGGGAAATPQQPSQQSQLMMAKVEMASYADLFERMSRVCFQKCKFKYNDGQLNVGEMSCIDRCAGKYMQAYSSLGVKMAQVEKEIMDQAAAGAGVGQQ